MVYFAPRTASSSSDLFIQRGTLLLTVKNRLNNNLWFGVITRIMLRMDSGTIDGHVEYAAFS